MFYVYEIPQRYIASFEHYVWINAVPDLFPDFWWDIPVVQWMSFRFNVKIKGNPLGYIFAFVVDVFYVTNVQYVDYSGSIECYVCSYGLLAMLSSV